MSGRLYVQSLGKSYRQWGSEFLRIASWFISSLTPREERWVLKDVSFSIGSGEAVGIIGQNGAGKSTLLKLITGTTKPTQGNVELFGRVSAILELGMGFNPDLTGRQNAYHSAGLMGYSQVEIERNMHEIQEFSEVGLYFDRPVRTYSSGMQMRVAFSVATAFKPDLLIVDEALSVGDSYFQHKCFERIRQFRSEGVSIMLVTHSMGDVRALCDRVILLDKGVVLKDGKPDEVVDFYNVLIAAKENTNLMVEQRREKGGWLFTKSGTGEARIQSIKLIDARTGSDLKVVQVGQILELQMEVLIYENIPKLVLGVKISDKQGHIIWGTNTWHTHQVESFLVTREIVNYRFKFICNLGPGSYSLSVALCSSDTHLINNYEWSENLLIFDVVNANKTIFIGSQWMDVDILVDRSK